MKNGKAKVVVNGEFMGSVLVNILDKNRILVYEDYIDHESSFSKVYDLSKVNAEELEIEVVAQQKLLAKAKY